MPDPIPQGAPPDFGGACLSPPGLLDPYPIYARLRQQGGPAYSPALDLWLVGRHQDVSTVLRSPDLFGSSQALEAPRARPPEVQAVLDAAGYKPRLPLLADDPPAHGRLRRLVSKAFTPQRVAAMEPRIRAWLDELLAGHGDQGPAEPVSGLAVPLPMRVMCDLIGVPLRDVPRVKEFCEASALFTAGRLPPREHLACAHKVLEYRRYVRELVETQQRQPGPDLISMLLGARDQDEGGPPLSHEEVVGLCIVFIFAGHQTTTALIANSLLHLIRRPDLWQALATDADLCGRAIEEVLRYDAPVQGMMRTAIAATRVDGTDLASGARLFLAFGSANRDEAIFPEPDRFDVTRANIDQHLGFGRGIHFCIGSGLARLEARLVLQELSRRFPQPRLDEEAALEYSPNLIHRLPRSLRVRWT